MCEQFINHGQILSHLGETKEKSLLTWLLDDSPQTLKESELSTSSAGRRKERPGWDAIGTHNTLTESGYGDWEEAENAAICCFSSLFLFLLSLFSDLLYKCRKIRSSHSFPLLLFMFFSLLSNVYVLSWTSGWIRALGPCTYIFLLDKL